MDMWAVGVMLLDLVAAPGERTRDWSDTLIAAAIESRCLFSEVDLEMRGAREEDYRQLILGCLQYNPASRPTAGQLLKAVAAAKLKAAALQRGPDQQQQPPSHRSSAPPGAPAPPAPGPTGEALFRSALHTKCASAIEPMAAQLLVLLVHQSDAIAIVCKSTTKSARPNAVQS
jgi:serine/threonine protein kinase